MRLITILLTLFITSCDPIDFKLKVYNNSSTSIYIIHSFTSNLSLLDSTVAEPYNGIAIKPQENYTVRANYIKWEDAIRTDSKDGKLRVYIFDEETVSKYSWHHIVSNNLYSKKFELLEVDLKKINWIITYSENLN